VRVALLCLSSEAVATSSTLESDLLEALAHALRPHLLKLNSHDFVLLLELLDLADLASGVLEPRVLLLKH